MSKQRKFVCLSLDNQDSSLLETPINDYFSLFECLDNEGRLIVNIIVKNPLDFTGLRHLSQMDYWEEFITPKILGDKFKDYTLGHVEGIDWKLIGVTSNHEAIYQIITDLSLELWCELHDYLRQQDLTIKQRKKLERIENCY